MIEEPVTRDVIGKYVVYFNGCFAPRRDLKIVDISKDGLRISFEWGENIYTEHIMNIRAIIDNIGDEYCREDEVNKKGKENG